MFLKLAVLTTGAAGTTARRWSAVRLLHFGSAFTLLARERTVVVETRQVVLLFFGLVNGGVVLAGEMPGAWAVLAAALIGRPIGILASVALAMAAGLRLPAHLRWRELIVVSLAASAGFTFALFFATSVMPPGPLLGELKLGALATAVGGLVAWTAARLLHVGRFMSTPVGRLAQWH